MYRLFGQNMKSETLTVSILCKFVAVCFVYSMFLSLSVHTVSKIGSFVSKDNITMTYTAIDIVWGGYVSNFLISKIHRKKNKPFKKGIQTCQLAM